MGIGSARKAQGKICFNNKKAMPKKTSIVAKHKFDNIQDMVDPLLPRDHGQNVSETRPLKVNNIRMTEMKKGGGRVHLRSKIKANDGRYTFAVVYNPNEARSEDALKALHKLSKKVTKAGMKASYAALCNSSDTTKAVASKGEFEEDIGVDEKNTHSIDFLHYKVADLFYRDPTNGRAPTVLVFNKNAEVVWRGASWANIGEFMHLGHT